MKKIILSVLLLVCTVSFSNISGIDTKKVLRNHYGEKDTYMKSNDYYFKKVGKDFNFRAFEWSTSKDTAIKIYGKKDYVIKGNELIFTDINFAGMVLSELHLTYENDRLVSWTGIGRPTFELTAALIDTYKKKYKDTIIESESDSIKMLITKERTNSMFIILDPDMITFYYQSPELYDRVIKGETEEKEMERIRIENEKKQKDKAKQDMLNDL